ARRVTHHRHRRLQGEPRQRLAELRGIAQWAPWRARRHRGESAASTWIQAILPGQEPGGRKEPPFVQLASRDLAEGERLDDLRPILAGSLCLSLTNAGCLAGKKHL